MSDTKPELGKPMDDEAFKRYLTSSRVPVRFSERRGGSQIDYDLRITIHHPEAKNVFGKRSLRFGNYIRTTEGAFESIDIGVGRPYKTDVIIVSFDNPLLPNNFAINPKHRSNLNPHSDLKPTFNGKLIERFLEAAKEVGVTIPMPKTKDQRVVVSMSLTPVKKGSVTDPKTCAIEVTSIEVLND